MQELKTADGIPLKISLQRAQKREKVRAFLLVAPLLFFILITFLIPIADMLLLSVDNTIVSEVMHRTTKSLESWDSQSGELPNETAFAALLADLKEAKKNRTHTRIGQRLNYETSGLSSLFRSAGNVENRSRFFP